MHTEVFNNIDILINMANSSLTIDEINMELISLRRQINNKRNEIEDLQSLMTEARYFNASNELVDKNIEISLKNKISRLNRNIKDITNHISDIKSQEKSLHNDITNLKARLKKNEAYVKTLTVKAENSSNNTYYKDLLEKETANVEELHQELTEKETQYEDVLKELELNNQANTELNDKLTNEKNRLNDVLDNLQNPNAYVDEDLKRSDEEKLDLLTEELDKLEKRKIELLTDANMIGTDAKELIVNNDFTEALNKVKELVTIVKTKPFMDIWTPGVLEEELEKKEALRVEVSSLIDNKNYATLDNNVISKRMTYLKNENNNLRNSITKYQNEINTIDEFVNNTLGPAINELESEILVSEKNIKEYRSILAEKNKTNRNKATIENTISKKEKEKEVLNDILNGYKEDLLTKISETNILNGIKNNLEAEIEDNEIELVNLEKVSMLDLKTKDVVEEENDKEKLRAINDEIKAIKNRQKFDKSPDEIYDQIEMYLANAGTTPLRTEKNHNRNYEIENLFAPSMENKKVEEKSFENNIYEGIINEEQPPKEIETNVEEPVVAPVAEPIIEEPVVESIPEATMTKPFDTVQSEVKLEEPIKEPEHHENVRLKVIEMIPVETVKKDPTAVGGN